MFKERLKIVGIKLIELIMILIFVLLFFVVILGASSINTEYTIVVTIFEYVLNAFLGLLALSFIIYVITYMVIFINWLFVEPYKAREKNKKK